MTNIAIDHSSSVAPYDQLRQQIIEEVQSGGLIAGAKIPTVRALASDLGLAANTVAKAYRVLGEQGVIETRGKQGTFIASGTDPVRARAEQEATSFAKSVRALGYSNNEIVEMVEAALRGA
ncbi:GntR family transcriptional regulator [Rhodococcus sp. ARC_M6]|uniref:GntR family transcriptional regulator n=1 Tax=Rhodococcus sp. ARC_M6 TaxID=2928852 RepID=UPI001FB368F2|nr:GntR family transcriptional regulator [Rhodococcus sp. ARC_M6]MCJ0904011.1 GntR family transcriptional regulator [Rhodococcus sp. ARC_M6]